MQMANNYMIKRLNIIIIREMNMKTTRKCHFTSTRMAAIKDCVQEVEPPERSDSVSGNENVVTTLE